MTQTANTKPVSHGDATLALLWERVRQQGDMPGFTKAVSAILGAMRGEDEHEFNMTQTVLSDPVLTQKVLRLANSGMYAAFGQRVNTVSKAVLVLGTEAIGHLALGLKLIEELSNSSGTSTMAHIEMEKAVLAGMVAQQVAASAAAPDTEEAVVCSMLHTLGRMMITFYMPERWTALQAHAGAGSEDAAAGAVLGLSLEKIGRAAAEHWGLPKNLINGMRRIEPAERGAEFTHEDWLAALATMSSQAADSLWHDDAAGAVAVRALASSFAPMLGVAADALMTAIDKAKVVAAADLSIAPLAKPAEKRAAALATTRMRAEGNKILISGVSDMRDVIATASPGQMMSMALETVYQGLTFSRAIAFLRNRRENTYAAKMGFGDGVKALIPAMIFEDTYEPNVFHASLNSDRVIFIENAKDPKFAAKLPHWWRSSLSDARSFVILPLCTNGQPAGFIYGDWDESFPAIQLNQTEFSLLNDLRSLVVKAVERRQQAEIALAASKAG
jgi:HD-like signal output (HDOD) protein